MNKPLIRTFHNLSCSGGSVISKCIQSMEKTIVVSEVHPDYLQYNFNPFDPTQLLLAQTTINEDLNFRRKIFLNRIRETYSILMEKNYKLVLRDHTHSDYLIQNSINEIKSKATLINTIRQDFKILSVLVIRNPLQSFIGLKKNHWDTYISSFDDYCKRILLFLNTYEKLNCKIFRYEDFCENPEKIIRHICLELKINFVHNFEQTFYKVPMTGDSGRGKKYKKIMRLEDKDVSSSLKNEALCSNAFMEISDRLNYKV